MEPFRGKIKAHRQWPNIDTAVVVSPMAQPSTRINRSQASRAYSSEVTLNPKIWRHPYYCKLVTRSKLDDASKNMPGELLLGFIQSMAIS